MKNFTKTLFLFFTIILFSSSLGAALITAGECQEEASKTNNPVIRGELFWLRDFLRGHNLNTLSCGDANVCFHCCVVLDLVDEAGLCIDQGADVNRDVKYFGPALKYAVSQQSPKMVELLIKKGASLGGTELYFLAMEPRERKDFTSLRKSKRNFVARLFSQERNQVLEILLKAGVPVAPESLPTFRKVFERDVGIFNVFKRYWKNDDAMRVLLFAGAGKKECQMQLASNFAEGKNGFPKNVEEATYWYEKLGDKAKIAKLKEKKVDWAELAKKYPEIPETVAIPGKNYRMGKYEVTNYQYWVITQNYDGLQNYKSSYQYPANTRWNAWLEYCKNLTRYARERGVISKNEEFRLPTSEEWEHACRAGTTTKYYSGDSVGDLNRIAWWRGNSGRKHPHRPVGQKEPNAWGLYDMLGNQWEICSTNDGFVLRGGDSWTSEGDIEISRVFWKNDSNRTIRVILTPVGSAGTSSGGNVNSGTQNNSSSNDDKFSPFGRRK